MSLINLPLSNGINIVGTVDTFPLLPTANLHQSEVWRVVNNAGVYLFNRTYKGLYVSDGIDWVPLELDSPAYDAIDALRAQFIAIPPSNNTVANFSCTAQTNVADWVISVNGVASPGLADSIDNSNILGVVESKQSSTVCTIRVGGITETIFSGLDTTKEYYLSDTIPGHMVAQDGGIPTAAGHILLKLGQPTNTQQFLVNKGTRVVRS